MDELLIPATANTPEIEFKLEDNIFRISGRSMPETPEVFYSEVMNWLNTRSPQINVETEVSLDFDYLDAPSFGYIVEIIKIFEGLKSAQEIVRILWYHDADDSDTLEMGEELKELSELDLSIQAKTKD